MDDPNNAGGGGTTLNVPLIPGSGRSSGDSGPVEGPGVGLSRVMSGGSEGAVVRRTTAGTNASGSINLQVGEEGGDDFPNRRLSTVGRSFIQNIEERIENEEKHKLSEWFATAICGNDILSSCLYVSGLVTLSAGKLAPFTLLLVALVLYFYRSIYGEVVSTIPMNGGAYNVLINTSSKQVAAFAACFAILSYIATGVVSATSAASYMKLLWSNLEIVPFTILLLLLFATLVTMGISESAVVALGMFILHAFTLSFLVVISIIYASSHGDIWTDNWNNDYPSVTIGNQSYEGSFFTAILFGFGSAMLGVSGFESSSQFVEEQGDGVFLKTLRNMWCFSSFFNPALSFLSFAVLTEKEITDDYETVLATMARKIGEDWGGDWGQIFKDFVCIDAFIVLCGATLTGYVGVNGLVRRMARDRCLPEFLLTTNEWRGTNHYILFGFFLLATSLELVLNGDTSTLSDVYAFAFLSLMLLLSFGLMMLKFKRPDMPRVVVCPWSKLLGGVLMVGTALVANILSKSDTVSYFLIYYLVAALVVGGMFQRVALLKLTKYFLAKNFPGSNFPWIDRSVAEFNSSAFIFFAKHDNLRYMNKAVMYCRNNEQTENLTVVHVYDPAVGFSDTFASHVEMLNDMYPKINVSFVPVKGKFNPATVAYVSEMLAVPINMMFITCPDAEFQHKLQHLGGLRIITQ